MHTQLRCAYNVHACIAQCMRVLPRAHIFSVNAHKASTINCCQENPDFTPNTKPAVYEYIVCVNARVERQTLLGSLPKKYRRRHRHPLVMKQAISRV